MNVIAEERWSHVLFDDGQGWVLTLLMGGVVDIDVSIRLTTQEIAQIRSDPAQLKQLVRSVQQGRNAFAAREIRPPVWPPN